MRLHLGVDDDLPLICNVSAQFFVRLCLRVDDDLPLIWYGMVRFGG